MKAQDDATEKMIKFMKSRKNKKSRDYATLILGYLFDAKYKNPDNYWVRARELQTEFVDTNKIESESALFRQLSDLQKYGLIAKRAVVEIGERSRAGKKKPSVYYAVSIDSQPTWGTDIDYMGRTARRYGELAIAKDLLREAGIEDPDAAIKKRFDEMYGVQVLPDED